MSIAAAPARPWAPGAAQCSIPAAGVRDRPVLSGTVLTVARDQLCLGAGCLAHQDRRVRVALLQLSKVAYQELPAGACAGPSARTCEQGCRRATAAVQGSVANCSGAARGSDLQRRGAARPLRPHAPDALARRRGLAQVDPVECSGAAGVSGRPRGGCSKPRGSPFPRRHPLPRPTHRSSCKLLLSTDFQGAMAACCTLGAPWPRSERPDWLLRLEGMLGRWKRVSLEQH